MTVDATEARTEDFAMIVRWVEGYYDKEVDLGDGTYKKERVQGFAYWDPDPYAFKATHWMPLPIPPEGKSEVQK